MNDLTDKFIYLIYRMGGMAWRPKTSASGGFAKRDVEKRAKAEELQARNKGVKESRGDSSVDAYKARGESIPVDEQVDSSQVLAVKVPAVRRGNKQGSIVANNSGMITFRDERGRVVYQVRPGEPGYDAGLREYNRAVRNVEKEGKFARAERSRIREVNLEGAKIAEERGYTAGSYLKALQSGPSRSQPNYLTEVVMAPRESVGSASIEKDSAWERANKKVSEGVRRIPGVGSYLEQESLAALYKYQDTYTRERDLEREFAGFEGASGFKAGLGRGYRDVSLGALKVERFMLGLQAGSVSRLKDEPLGVAADVGVVAGGGLLLKGGELAAFRVAGKYPKIAGLGKTYRAGEEFLGPALLTSYGFGVAGKMIAAPGAYARGRVLGGEEVNFLAFYGGGKIASRLSKTVQYQVKLEEGFQKLPGSYSTGRQGEVRAEFKELKASLRDVRRGGLRKPVSLPFENVENLTPEAAKITRGFVEEFRGDVVVGGSLSSKTQVSGKAAKGLRASGDVDLYSDVPGMARVLHSRFKEAGIVSRVEKGKKIIIRGKGKAVEFHPLTREGAKGFDVPVGLKDYKFKGEPLKQEHYKDIIGLSEISGEQYSREYFKEGTKQMNKLFMRSGVSFYDSKFKDYSGDKPLGEFSPKYNAIRIDKDIPKGTSMYWDTKAHEVGHLVNYRINVETGYSVRTSKYVFDRDFPVEAYSRSDLKFEKEAESFKDFVHDPVKFGRKYPEIAGAYSSFLNVDFPKPKSAVKYKYVTPEGRYLYGNKISTSFTGKSGNLEFHKIDYGTGKGVVLTRGEHRLIHAIHEGYVEGKNTEFFKAYKVKGQGVEPLKTKTVGASKLSLQENIESVKSGWLPLSSAYVETPEGVRVTKFKYQAARKLFGGFEVEVNKSGVARMDRYSKDVPDYLELVEAARLTPRKGVSLFGGRAGKAALFGPSLPDVVPEVSVGKSGRGRFKGNSYYAGLIEGSVAGVYPSRDYYPEASGKPVKYPGFGRKVKGGYPFGRGYPSGEAYPVGGLGYPGGPGESYPTGVGYPKGLPLRKSLGYPSGGSSYPKLGGGLPKLKGSYGVPDFEPGFGGKPEPVVLQDKFFGKKKKRDALADVKFGPEYVSSVEARLFDIRGKVPRGGLTGLELRPLFKGR